MRWNAECGPSHRAFPRVSGVLGLTQATNLPWRKWREISCLECLRLCSWGRLRWQGASGTVLLPNATVLGDGGHAIIIGMGIDIGSVMRARITGDTDLTN